MKKNILIAGGIFVGAVIVLAIVLFSTSSGVVGQFTAKADLDETTIDPDILEPAPFSNQEEDLENRLIVEETEAEIVEADDPTLEIKKIAFVTSGEYSGNFPRLKGADEKCNDLAETVGLRGNYLAWLSDSENDAIDRFNQEGSYYDVKGNLIARTFNDFLIGDLKSSIILTEKGEQVSSNSKAWTGTGADGLRMGKIEGVQPYCVDWTNEGAPLRSGYGSPPWKDLKWTDAGVSACNQKLRLYCLQE